MRPLLVLVLVLVLTAVAQAEDTRTNADPTGTTSTIPKLITTTNNSNSTLPSFPSVPSSKWLHGAVNALGPRLPRGRHDGALRA
jgi:hypothetical protein